MAKSKSNAAKNIIVLFLVALLSVSALAVLNQITRDPIAKAEADARAEVYEAVYGEGSTFEETDINESYKPADNSIVINAVLKAVDKDGNSGYVIDATSKNGYGGDVQVAIGITDEGEITAFKAIDVSGETPGLGARATEEEFAAQFSGLKAEEIAFSKTGANRDNNEIDAISGATITTTAVTNAVNEAITLFNTALKGE